MLSIPFKTSQVKLQHALSIVVILSVLVVCLDLVEARFRNYSFYLSESLLFSTFWMLFVPLILTFRRLSQKRFHMLLPLAFSVFHLVFFSILVFAISSLVFDNNTFAVLKTLRYAVTEHGLVCLIIYVLCSPVFSKHKTSSIKEDRSATDKIKVTYKNQQVILPCTEILYAKAEKPYVALITKEQTFLHNSSLKEFIQNRSTNFIQIHRSLIVNTDYITGYTSRKNGDYDLHLTNKETIRASRSFNLNFKPFFDHLSSE